MTTLKSILALFIIFFIHITSYADEGRLSPGLSAKLQCANHKEYISVIVRMADQVDLKAVTHRNMRRKKALRSTYVIRVLQENAIKKQQDLIIFLEKEKALGNVANYIPFWIFNGLAVRATPKVIEKIALQNNVKRVSEDLPITPPEFLPSAPLQIDSLYTWNIKRIKAPEAWDMGYAGSGVVVGIFDSGVDYTHPDLTERYRGGDNSWFDPFGEHDQPYDYEGHGTYVTGIIVGGNASEKHIGVAPGAKWIAARAWNDEGESSTSKKHEVFQWFMDPDGDPETDDAPDVVNCSWGITLFDFLPWCLFDFQDDLKAWQMVGIIPVFSAGNSGPMFFTGKSPATYQETIAVGSTDFFDIIAFTSSRGPNNCDLGIFPDICAPGLPIFTSIPDWGYEYQQGTSMAAPHVVGTIALMLEANPNLNFEEIKSTLKATAKPLGLVHPNNTYGWGRVDALEAVKAVIP